CTLFFLISLFFTIICLSFLSSLFPYTTLFRSFLADFKFLLRKCGGPSRDGRTEWYVRSKETIFNWHHWKLKIVSLDRTYHSVLRSEEHTSELQSRFDLVCRLLLEKKKKNNNKK